MVRLLGLNAAYMNIAGVDVVGLTFGSICHKSRRRIFF